MRTYLRWIWRRTSTLLRAKFKGGQSEVTKKIAAYLTVSPATVTQYEKLLKLEPDIQQKVHEGEIKMSAAFVLEKVDKDKRPTVLSEAIKLQEAESNRSKEIQTDADTPATKKKPRDTGTVKTRHVKEAARQIQDDSAKPQSRSRKDIIEFFDGLEGPVSGYPDGVPHTFIRAFKLWCKGGSSDRTLEKVWLELIERCPKGHSAAAKAPAKK